MIWLGGGIAGLRRAPLASGAAQAMPFFKTLRVLAGLVEPGTLDLGVVGSGPMLGVELTFKKIPAFELRVV